jgi:ATP synthase, F1 gamma subunit
VAGQSVREIRRRINSVKNMRQITRAMEMVAAAKLRRAQMQVTANRPFSRKLREVLARLVTAARSAEGDGRVEHPLLEVREVKRVLYVVITADRGLAGGYNVNVLRRLQGIMDEDTREFEVVAIGRKGREYLRKRGLTPLKEYVHIGDDIPYSFARELAGELMEAFTSGQFDEINLVYTEFVSVVTQRPVVKRLLPVEELSGSSDGEEAALEYIYEPSPESVINILLPRFVETEVYAALMEAKASEMGARMTAMRNATDNATEMIEELTLNYNRARQAGITKEISEIVGGAEALAE